MIIDIWAQRKCICCARFHDSVHLEIARGPFRDREIAQPSRDWLQYRQMWLPAEWFTPLLVSFYTEYLLLSVYVAASDDWKRAQHIDMIVFYVGYRSLPELLVLSNLSLSVRGLLVKFTVYEL